MNSHNIFNNMSFLHDRPWISPWIKSISYELNITFHVLAPQLSGNCDVISNRLRRHLQNLFRAGEKRCRCVRIVVFFVIYSSACRVRNKMIYVPSWQAVSVLTRVLFLCLLFISQTRKQPSRQRRNTSQLECIHYSLYQWKSRLQSVCRCQLAGATIFTT